MGIFDFLKKKLEEIGEQARAIKEESEKEKLEQEANREIPEKERLEFKELENWLNQRHIRERENSKKILKEIHLAIDKFIKRLDEKREILLKVDIKDKKVQELLKQVSEDNLHRYIDYLRRLGEKLKECHKEDLEKAIQDIDKTFLEFNQQSRVVYERATILIGKELGEAKETVISFGKEINSIINNNKELLEDLKISLIVKTSLAELKELDNQKAEIASNTKEAERKLSFIKEKEGELEQKLTKKRKSEEYLLQEERKQKALITKGEIERKLLKLKKELDFKNLEKTFHSIDKKLKIVREYESDFNKILSPERNELIDLFEESKKERTRREIETIILRKEEIHNVFAEKSILENPIQELANLKGSIEQISLEKEQSKKKIQKIEENINLRKSELKSQLRKKGIILL